MPSGRSDSTPRSRSSTDSSPPPARARHVAVDLGDDQRRGGDEIAKQADRDAEADDAVARRRHLDHDHVGRKRPVAPHHAHDVAEAQRQQVDRALAKQTAQLRRGLPGDVAEAVAQPGAQERVVAELQTGVQAQSAKPMALLLQCLVQRRWFDRAVRQDDARPVGEWRRWRRGRRRASWGRGSGEAALAAGRCEKGPRRSSSQKASFRARVLAKTSTSVIGSAGKRSLSVARSSSLFQRRKGLVSFSEAIVVGVVYPPSRGPGARPVVLLPQGVVARLEGQGKAQVLLGVLVSEVDAGVVGQGEQLRQRFDHHRRVALEETAAAAGEQGVAGEDALVAPRSSRRCGRWCARE